MRYKAAPLSVRAGSPVTTRPKRFTSDTFRLLVVAVLVPVILIPLAVANAAVSISLSPTQAAAGATVTATGQGLQPNSRGQLTFDGSTSGMPTFRVDRAGRMTVSFVVPRGASVGSHTITATVTSKNTPTKNASATTKNGSTTAKSSSTQSGSVKNGVAAAAVVVASAALMVIAVSSPTPTSTPTSAP